MPRAGWCISFSDQGSRSSVPYVHESEWYYRKAMESFFLIILTCFRYKTVSLMKDWRKRHALPFFYWQQIIWHHEQFGPLQGQDMLRSNAGSSRITKNGSSHECHMIGGAWSAELSHLSRSCQPCSPCLMLSWLCGIEFRNVYQSATDPQILVGGCVSFCFTYIWEAGVFTVVQKDLGVIIMGAGTWWTGGSMTCFGVILGWRLWAGYTSKRIKTAKKTGGGGCWQTLSVPE